MNWNIILLFLAVLIGGVIVEFFKPNKGKNLQLLLTFSGSYLLAISILHLIPDLFQNYNNENLGIFILLGILIQIILEYFSKGIEHGHFHQERTIPLSVMISLCLHAIIEGVPLGGGFDKETERALLTGILLHKIPVAIVLFTFFLQSNISKRRSYLLLILFATMSPMGLYAGEYFENLSKYSNEIMATVTGIFLHISTTILFESSKGHQFNLSKIIIIILGSYIAFISMHIH